MVDGDTVHTFYGDEIFKIRLTEIDAPERDQPFGKASTEHLKSLLKDGRVDVDISGTAVSYTHLTLPTNREV